jgi:hypothetical protein
LIYGSAKGLLRTLARKEVCEELGIGSGRMASNESDMLVDVRRLRKATVHVTNDPDVRRDGHEEIASLELRAYAFSIIGGYAHVL